MKSLERPNLSIQIKKTDSNLHKEEEARVEEIGKILYGEDGWELCKQAMPGEPPHEVLLLAVKCDNGKSRVRFLDIKPYSIHNPEDF